MGKKKYCQVYSAAPEVQACPPAHYNRYYALLEQPALQEPYVAVRCMHCNQGWYLDRTSLTFTAEFIP